MAKWLVKYAGVEITIKANKGPARQMVEHVIAAMPHKRVKQSKGVRLSLKFADGAWHLNDKTSKEKRRLTRAGDVIYHLSDRIVFHVADKAKGVHCLHAATVSHNGRALVVPADSGSGKSTLTTWLVAQGFDYLTDELILIHEDGSLEGIARPIQIKSHGIDVIQPYLQQPGLVQEGRLANAIPIHALSDSRSIKAADKVALFLFPKFEKKAEYKFHKLQSADAGMRLMGNHVNARNLEGHGFRAMMKLIRETPCYSLNYGGFDKLPNDFIPQLQELLAAAPAEQIASNT